MTIEPLYLQAKNKTLGPLQILDQETLDWIKHESSSFLEDVTKEHKLLELSESPKITLEQLELIKLLVPKLENFYSPKHYGSIHGISHITRVMYITTLICNLIGETNFFNEFLITASIHDIRRVNDNEDRGHGGRAYKWFKNNLDQYSNLFEFNGNNLQIIKQATVFHQIDYKDIPTQIYEKYSYYIDVFKSADALDRFRQPKAKWWPNPNYINFKEAIKLLKICNQFTILTEQAILNKDNKKTEVETIHEIAKQLFLITK